MDFGGYLCAVYHLLLELHCLSSVILLSLSKGMNSVLIMPLISAQM